jgi:hypothetical protein
VPRAVALYFTTWRAIAFCFATLHRAAPDVGGLHRRSGSPRRCASSSGAASSSSWRSSTSSPAPGALGTKHRRSVDSVSVTPFRASSSRMAGAPRTGVPWAGWMCAARAAFDVQSSEPASDHHGRAYRATRWRDDALGLRGDQRARDAVDQPRRPRRRDALLLPRCYHSGAEGEIRTHTPLRAADFKSAASAIPPLRPADIVAA